MSKKIGELFASLLQKVGADLTAKEYAGILADQTEVTENIATAFDGLMTLEGAKNNLNIKNHFVHQAYNPLDREIHSQADIFGLSDDQKEILNAEKSTGKKQKLLFQMLDEMVKDKTKAKDPDTSNFKKEIDELRKQLSEKDVKTQEAVSLKEKELNDYILKSQIEAEFGKYDWSENYSPEVRSTLAQLELERELSSRGAKLILDSNKKAVLVKSDNPELEYFDNSNKKIIFGELVPKLMADRKFLRVSDKGTTTQTQVITGQQSQGQSATQSKSNSRLQSALDKAKATQGLS